MHFQNYNVNRGIILLTEAEEKSSIIGKSKAEAEDSVDHWTYLNIQTGIVKQMIKSCI